MEQDQKERRKQTVLGSDPFAGMVFGGEATPLPEKSLVNGGAADTAAALDELEAALFAAAEPAAELATEDTTIPEPEESHYLDDLIARIDDQIDALYGAESSLDLSGGRSVISGAAEQHIVFDLAGTGYAVPIGNVLEIGRPLPITLVPRVPPWLRGVVNLRGDVVSMVDLRGFLGLPPAAYERDGRMIIARSNDEEMTVGLLVDRVSGIRFLAAGRIVDPAAISDRVTPYLRGVYEDNGRLLAVLDLDRLLLSPEMQQFEA